MVTYYLAVDDVFRALGDPTRRSLLDELFREDGQTLGALEGRLPMSRFGVMKHLRVLEKAGLVVTKRRGREKLHFLNPIPIRLIHDRWVSKYAAPWAAALSDLKHELERGDKTMEKVFVIYIKTTPERLWDAITDFDKRRIYTFGVGVKSNWKAGSSWVGVTPKVPTPVTEGEILEIDAPARAELPGLVGRRRQERRHLARDVGDRSRRRLMLPYRHARSASRRRERRAVRRLADDPLRSQDTPRNGRESHHAGIAELRVALRASGPD